MKTKQVTFFEALEHMKNGGIAIGNSIEFRYALQLEYTYANIWTKCRLPFNELVSYDWRLQDWCSCNSTLSGITVIELANKHVKSIVEMPEL